jgi:heptosyltransferase-3
MTSACGKILVIRGGAIGDFILTLPAVAALRTRFPEAHLEVLGYPHIVQLALAGGLVDRVQSIEARALAGFFARGGILDADLMDYFSEFDLILSYLFDPDGIFQANVARCSPGQFIVGPHRPNESEKVHAARVYLKPLERLAIFEADPLPRLDLARNQEQGRADLLVGQDARVTPKVFGAGRVPTMALHPGSGSERKNWPELSWADLLQDLLNTTPWNLLLVGGEAEGERLQRLAAALPPARVRVVQNLPLAELARRLQPCDAFVGHDSGISHLAAALGLPGLVLWGDTIEEIWRPPHPNVAILKGPTGLSTLSVERVIGELRPLLRQKI